MKLKVAKNKMSMTLAMYSIFKNIYNRRLISPWQQVALTSKINGKPNCYRILTTKINVEKCKIAHNSANANYIQMFEHRKRHNEWSLVGKAVKKKRESKYWLWHRCFLAQSGFMYHFLHFGQITKEITDI